MKFRYAIFAAVAALLLFASCSKDEEEVVARHSEVESTMPQGPDRYRPVQDDTVRHNLVEVVFHVDPGSKAGVYNQRGTRIGFCEGDSIYVSDNTGAKSGAVAEGVDGLKMNDRVYSGVDFTGAMLDASATSYFAIYPYRKAMAESGGVVSGITLPAAQEAVLGSFRDDCNISYAESSTTTLRFHLLVTYLRVRLRTNSGNAAQIKIESSTEGLAGAATFSRSAKTLSAASGAAKSITMVPQGGGLFANDTCYFAVILPGRYTQLTFTALASDGSTVVARGVVRDREYEGGGIYTVVLNGSTLDVPGASSALDGEFAVGASSRVRFASGNLQYNSSKGYYRFARFQYTAVGAVSADGWSDLFGWGTGTQPALTSTDNAQYAAFAEWGDNDVDGLAGEWRTLTAAEWHYLLDERPDAAAKRAMSTVAGVQGLVLLPESWTLPAGLSFASGYSSSYNRNTYSAAQWKSMQAAGALFLPAAGYRNGTAVQLPGSEGSYWSSSVADGSAGYLLFGCGDAMTNSNDQRYMGRSVRLARDV